MFATFSISHENKYFYFLDFVSHYILRVAFWHLIVYTEWQLYGTE